jgi:L-iditol 2-dehydrogenase
LKALLHTKPYCLEYCDYADPTPGDDDVLIRVKACGICGSDVQGFTGKTGRRIPPIIMGHEAAGVIEWLGKNAAGFGIGDRVTFDSTVYCNKCPSCQAGLFNRCEKRQVLGVSTDEFKRHGAFAEFVCVPWWIVAKIPDNLSFAHAAMLEPVSIASHAVNRATITTGDAIAVIGAGTIGLLVIQAARLTVAGTVIACDINDFRLDIAKRLRADVIINTAKCDPVQMVLEQTGNKGVDVAFEVVGYAETFRAALSVTKTGGRIVSIGNVQKMVEFNLQDLVARELTISGSYASSGEFRECINLVASGKINVEPLISDVLPLRDGPAAFERLLNARENLLKIILEP